MAVLPRWMRWDMIFINRGDPIQVRIEEKNGYRWECVRKDETIDLPEEIGLIHGFELIKTTKGIIGTETVETKQIESIQKSNQDGEFLKELIKIKGIGKEYANDIIIAFPNEECLRKAIKENKELQFRKDINKILREIYG